MKKIFLFFLLTIGTLAGFYLTRQADVFAEYISLEKFIAVLTILLALTGFGLMLIIGIKTNIEWHFSPIIIFFTGIIFGGLICYYVELSNGYPLLIGSALGISLEIGVIVFYGIKISFEMLSND